MWKERISIGAQGGVCTNMVVKMVQNASQNGHYVYDQEIFDQHYR